MQKQKATIMAVSYTHLDVYKRQSDLCEYTTGINVPCDGGTWDVQRPFMAWKAAGKL